MSSATGDPVTDKLCHERMRQMQSEIETLERGIAQKLSSSDAMMRQEIKNLCETNRLELKALRNYIVGMSVGISIVIVIVNLLLYLR